MFVCSLKDQCHLESVGKTKKNKQRIHDVYTLALHSFIATQSHNINKLPPFELTLL